MTTALLAVSAIAWVVTMSVLTHEIFRLDKQQSQIGGRRISERTLLLLALMGGAIGGKFAQQRFRHKTRKEPFRTILNLAVIANVALATSLLVPDVRAAVLRAIATFQSLAAPIGPDLQEPRRFGPGS